MQCVDALLQDSVQAIGKGMESRWERKTVRDVLKALKHTLSASGSEQSSSVGALLRIADILQSCMSTEKVLRRLHIAPNV